MKKSLYLILFPIFSLWGLKSHAQVTSFCDQIAPACAQAGVSFTNTTGSPSLGTISCLYSTPNPAFFYMEIENPGPINIALNQYNVGGSGIDVDFALWGPFTSVASGCSAIVANPGATIDCSFSASASEQIDIPNGQPGQIYILLLTNYSNQPGTISFIQNGGSGSTDCSILDPATNNGPLCVGDTLKLFVDTTNTPGPYFFSWTGPNGFTSNVQYPVIPNSTVAMTGQYQVIVTNGGTFEMDTLQTTVTVNPIPAAPTWTMTPVCEGAQFCFSPDPPLINGAVYNWTASIGSSTLNSVAVPYCNIGLPLFDGVDMNLSVILNGCTSLAVTHTINLKPIPDMSISGPIEGCEGVPILLTANSIPAVVDSYYWSPSGETNQNILGLPGTTYTVSGSLDGCVGTSAPFTVGIIPNPLTISGNSPFCSNNTIELTATGGKNVYIWNGIPTADSVFTVTPNMLPMVHLSVENTNGCIREDSVQLTVYPAPIPDFSPTAICDQSPVSFLDETIIDSVSNAGNGIINSYFWDFGDAANTSTEENPVFTYANPGNYTVIHTVTTSDGCIDSIIKVLSVRKNPIADFNATPLCFGVVMFNDTSIAGDTTILSHEFTFSDNSPLETQTTFDKVFEGNPANIEVTLTVVDQFGCSDDTVKTVPITSTPDFTELPNIITPGGTLGMNDFLDLGPNGAVFDLCYDYSIQFFNRWGQKVYEITESTQKFEGLSNTGGKLESGVYYYVIMADGKKRFGNTITIIRGEN